MAVKLAGHSSTHMLSRRYLLFLHTRHSVPMGAPNAVIPRVHSWQLAMGLQRQTWPVEILPATQSPKYGRVGRLMVVVLTGAAVVAVVPAVVGANVDVVAAGTQCLPNWPVPAVV